MPRAWNTKTPAPSGATDPAPAPPERQRFPRKTFLFLWLAGVLTGPLVLPYVLGLEAIATQPLPGMPGSIGALVGLVLLRNAVFLLPATAIGLLLAPSIGLGAPHLQHRLDGAPAPAEPLRSIVRPAVFWATVTAIGAFAVDALFLHGLGVTFPAPEIHARIEVAPWRGLLASFMAPFTEEILDRLFLLTLIAWVPIKIFKLGEGSRGRQVALWVAIVLTSLFFGLYHIGNEAKFAEVVPAIVQVRTVAIIFLPGLAFGWLYVRRGLEAAILSHFVIDLIVHVVRPIVESWLG